MIQRTAGRVGQGSAGANMRGDSSDSVTGKNSGVPVPARHGTGCVTVRPCRSRPGMERHDREISEGRRNILPFRNMPWNAALFRRAEAPVWNSTCRAAFVRPRLPVSCNAERAAAQTFRWFRAGKPSGGIYKRKGRKIGRGYDVCLTKSPPARSSRPNRGSG